MRKFNVVVNGKKYSVELEEGEGSEIVSAGDKLIVLEAMKMENDVFSPADGTVSYAVKKGDNVETGAVLAYIK